MNEQQFNKHHTIRFKQFSRKGYALFSCLGKEVIVGVLSVATLTCARAEGAGVKPVVDTDTLVGREIRLEEVEVTGSRAPLTLLQSAKIVSVITRDDIHRAAAESINDVLKLATGVDVRQRGGFGVQTDISINGGTFDQLAILLNGIPIGNPQTGHNASDFPVSLSDIERIEILEGAASRVFGSQAFSGAINIVTRKTAEHPLLQTEVKGGSYGTFGLEGRYSQGRIFGARTPWMLSASGGYLRSDGGTRNSDFEGGRFFSQAYFQPATWLDVTAQLGWNNRSYGANTFYSAKYNNQYEKTERTLASVAATLHNNKRTLLLTPSVYYNNFLDHYQLIRHATGAAKGENYHDLDVAGINVSGQLNWLLGKTAAGWELRTERILSTAYGDQLAQNEARPITDSERFYTRRGKRTNTSLFLEHNVLLGGFTLSAGVLANKNTGLDQSFRFYPGVDVSFRPNNHWKLFASWNKALRMPTFTDLYANNPAQIGDVNLKPENNTTYKAGIQYRLTGVELLLSGFMSRGRNMIDWVYESKESQRYHALNIGKLDNTGVNLDATLRPNEWWQAFPITLIKVGYAYMHQTHETTQPIFKSLYALEYLKHKFVAGMEHRIVSKLSASWALRWQQRMNGYHPYAKLDGKLMWNAEKYNLYLSADNITNHRYYDLGGVEQPGIWVMAGAAFQLNL